METAIPFIINSFLPLKDRIPDIDEPSFFEDGREFWDNLLKTGKNFDIKLYCDLIKHVILRMAPIPSNFSLDQFMNYMRHEIEQDKSLKNEIEKIIKVLNDLLELTRNPNVKIEEISTFELLEIIDDIQISLLEAVDYSNFRNNLNKDNASENDLQLLNETLITLETGAKNIIRLIDKLTLSTKIQDVQAEKLLEYYLEYNKYWSHLSFLVSQYALVSLIWNATPQQDSFSIPDIIDVQKLPQEYMDQLRQELTLLNQRLLQFWEHLSQIEDCDFSLDSYKELENPAISEEISQTKLKLLKSLYPDRKLKRFTHDKNALDFLFTFLDENLPENIDIEKYLEDDELD